MAPGDWHQLSDVKDVTLAILAGGAGSRMGGPKGELRISGRPILQYLLDRLNWPGPTLLVTAPGREHPPGWDRFDREAVDSVVNQGPLRGVLTALESAETEIVVVTTVDMPGVTVDGLRWLMSIVKNAPDVIGVMTRRIWEAEPVIEPFPSVFRRSAMTLLAERLANAERSVHALARHTRIRVMTAPKKWPPTFWTNLNTPTDLSAYLVDQKS